MMQSDPFFYFSIALLVVTCFAVIFPFAAAAYYSGGRGGFSE